MRVRVRRGLVHYSFCIEPEMTVKTHVSTFDSHLWSKQVEMHWLVFSFVLTNSCMEETVTVARCAFEGSDSVPLCYMHMWRARAHHAK